MRHFLPVAALAASLALPVQAEPQRWAVLGEWDVGWYPDLRGCLAFTQFETTAFFIGFDTAGPTRALDITVLDDRWTSIQPEQVYPVTLNFGRKDPWVLDMHGVHMDGAPGLHILVDADLHLRPGDRVGLVGRNGSGKTTLLRALLGHVDLDRLVPR